MHSHLKKSINQAHLENGRYEQIVSHLERELELNGLEAPDEMPINTVTPQVQSKTLKSPNQRATIAKNQVTIKISAVNSNEKKSKPEIIRTVPTITRVVPKQTLAPTIKFQTLPMQTIDKIKETTRRPVFSPCETCGRTNHSTEKCYLGANAANRPKPRNRRPEVQNEIQQRYARSNSIGKVQAAVQTLNSKHHVFSGELHVIDRRQMKYQNFHQFPRLSNSNRRRPLQINLTETNLIRILLEKRL